MPTAELLLPTDDQAVEMIVTGLMDAIAHVEVPVLAETTIAKPGKKAAKGRAGARGSRRAERPGGGADAVIQSEGKVYVVEVKEGVEVRAVPAVEARFRGALEHAVRELLHERSGSFWIEPAAQLIAEIVQKSLPEARRKVSEATIEKMVDALVETHDPLAAINAEIDAANAKARMRFMANFLTYSAEEVTQNAESRAQNRHQTASRWKKDGKIFSVSYQHKERFPAFQFREGRPLPVIAAVLAALPDIMSPWETAFWFVSTNGWLGGEAPVKCLRDQPDKVIEAARLEGDALVA